MKKKDFFISYTKNDEEWAKWICVVLEKRGYNSVLQAWDFMPGSNFVFHMNNALIECRRFIAVISKNYFESDYCQAEWTAAFTKDPRFNKALFIPVRVSDFNPTGLLAPIIYIDLYGIDRKKAEKRLLQGIDNSWKERTSNFPSKNIVLSRSNSIFSLPFRRNCNYIGRDDVLIKVKKYFSKIEGSIISIVGMAGVGKTQIALEYAYKNRCYGVVWWVDAGSITTIIEAYKEFALKKKLLNESVIDIALIKESIWNWMNENKNWLFIFDNAESLDVLHEFLPIKNNGHIIITSINTRLNRIGRSIHIDAFNEDEAIAYLNNRLPNTKDASLSIVAKKLGYFPLLLDRASSYILCNSIAVCDYIELWDKYGIHILDNHKYQSHDYPFTLTESLNRAIGKISNESSIQLLKLLSSIDSDSIERQFISKNKTLFNMPLRDEVENELNFNEIIAELIQYSLLRVENDNIYVSQMVKKTINNDVV